MITIESSQSSGHGWLHLPRRLFGVVCFLTVLACVTVSASVRAAIPATERNALIALYNSTNGAGWVHKENWLGAPGTECDWHDVACDSQALHVSALFLSNNHLTGTLPSLADFTELRVFDAWGNNLTGSIPPLQGMPNLLQFTVEVNNLSGSLPALSGMTALRLFRASENHLNGSIPSLAGLSNLQEFKVSDNELTGSLPALTDLTSLQWFEVDGNSLSGDVPDVPSPNNLFDGYSSLCPNALNPEPNADWDLATGQTPWYQNCGPLPDPVFADGFDL